MSVLDPAYWRQNGWEHVAHWRQGDYWLDVWDMRPDYGVCWAFSIRRRKTRAGFVGYANSKEEALARVADKLKHLEASQWQPYAIALT